MPVHRGQRSDGSRSSLQAKERIPEWFAPLLRDRLPAFHWHGDTFDLPLGAKSLARTDLYTNQAFTIGDTAVALQFHPEVTLDGLERW
jgi:GMP synthase (glutamine-hydrolysing)